ncbi:MAG: response regulator [Pseudodesulfovibrio sp.]|uniref:response regulator n=1 Tax=Pseudodesulfovibrio sp. TaxID=2035812 RepID=UPI003D149ACA
MSLDLNMRILVVDDSNTMQRIIKTALRDIGLRDVTTADDGDIAWDLLRRRSFDLVLSDHKMPRMCGEELLAKVRKDPDLKCVPFIMITAEAFRENVLTAVKLGVSSYIVKPFSAQQLKQKIEKVCTAVC